jgi:Asp-tRNA(Asn)/Glu-tRNA(Gln) amidotransferase A subunit family amidase
MVPAAFGTQTAASVIRPAAYCGIVGYKPTFGTLATAGAKALSPSLDTVGVFTRDVDDASFLVGELSKQRFELKPEAISRVGICRTPHWHMTEESTKAVVQEAESVFGADGVAVSKTELPVICERLVEVQTGIMFYEAAAAYTPELSMSREGLSEPFQQILAKGALIDGAMFAEFQRLTVQARKEVDALFETVDVLIAPSASGEAPEGLDSTGDPIFGRIWNLLGYPCVHVPVGVGPRGLPVGVTVVGPRWQDSRVLSAAKRLQFLVRNQTK